MKILVEIAFVISLMSCLLSIHGGHVLLALLSGVTTVILVFDYFDRARNDGWRHY